MQRTLFLASIASLLTACSTIPEHYATNIETVPSGANVVIRSSGIEQSCTSPCTLQVSLRATDYMSITKKGYMPFASNRPFDSTIASNIVAQAMTGKKLTRGGVPETLEFKLSTPEEYEARLMRRAEQKRKSLVENRESADCRDPSLVDADAKPLITVPAQFPADADRSGHCMVLFDVNTSGLPVNVATPYCTEPMFSSPSVQSVEKWRFAPRLRNGEAVSICGVETKVSFKLMNERGDVVPE